MAKKTASLELIEKLHGQIAKVLTEVLEEEEEVTELQTDEDGMTAEVGTGRMRKTVSAAMMAQAINFVHKQGVVADIEGDKNTERLKSVLEGKQKRSRLGDGKVAAIDDAREKRA